MAMPRAWPSLRVAARVDVDESVLDRGLVRRELLDHLSQPGMDRHQPLAQLVALRSVSTEPQAT